MMGNGGTSASDQPAQMLRVQGQMMVYQRIGQIAHQSRGRPSAPPTAPG